ncbi:hypothetical protein ABB29_10835 [Pseudoxanthomonas dokdonensis]|uniref:TIGR03016 family PEP-CTERM system-associated outer membrane protein n=2 Tax=Pseudoxanthomonas dokdonensis TaxID=344882 RepID=A0A0R0CHB9_9GAMM|nr:hypothetical protein ABB29_10835 [Pseudoxanthomonas dokdonensis]
MLHRILHTGIHVAVLMALPGAAKAARLNYDIGASVMHSDNINLSQDDPIDETVLAPRLRFTFDHSSSVLETALRGDFQYLDYTGGSYDNDLRGEFAGALDWTMLPERLHFFARDSLSRQSVDSLVAFTPGNQQQINVFEAGPSLYLRFGEAMRSQIDLRYTNSYAEETETLNNDRYNLAARLIRDLSPTDQLSFNLEATQTDYDSISEFYDYKRYDGYFTYNTALSSVTMNIDAGYSELEPRSGESASSPLLRAQIEWQLMPRSKLLANLSYEFADATQDLILRADQPVPPVNPGNPGIGNPDNPDLQIVPDIFKQKRGMLGYEYEGDRLNVLVQPYYEQLRYIRDDSFDQNSYGGQASARYQLRQTWYLNLLLARQQREFIDASRDDRDTTIGAGLEARFSRHWGAQFDYQYRKRDSNVGGQNYTENVVALAFTYFR